MNDSNILNLIEAERMYSHVLEIEGSRHPVDDFEKLNEVADYISLEFEKYGLRVNEHKFNVKDLDNTFRNIEGSIGDSKSAEFILGAHYDTVPNCPGANDNASGVAVMLETARTLSQVESLSNIRFIGFSLEEPSAVLRNKYREIAQRYGVMDDNDHYTSYRTLKLIKKHSDQLSIARGSIKTYPEAYYEVTENLKSSLTQEEYDFFNEIAKIYEGIMTSSWVGKTAIIGSSRWIRDALKSNKKISGVISIDSVGYASKKRYSQHFPKGLKMKIFKTHNVKEKYFIGDFIFVISNSNSNELAEVFCSQCQKDSINLPYACFEPSVTFEKFCVNLPFLLGSDHAPFWREGIPALELTDTANLRDPYAHTSADTINNLDFDFMKKVGKAVCMTAINRCQETS